MAFAIFLLRQPAKVPHLKMTAPERPCRCSLFQSQWQSILPARASMRDRSESHRCQREQIVQEMDGYQHSLIAAEVSLLLHENTLFFRVGNFGVTLWHYAVFWRAFSRPKARSDEIPC